MIQKVLPEVDTPLAHEVPLTFGAWVRERRMALHQTQAQLAQRIPCSLALIRKIERGERYPSESVALRLALALQLETTDHALFVRVARGHAGIHQLPAFAPSHLRLVSSIRITELPAPLDPILGRDAAIAAVSDMLSAHDTRLVTIIGTAGVGKTRLAIASATAVRNHFPDGVCFVDLAGIVDPAFIPAAIAAAVGMPDRAGSTIAQVATVLVTRRMLLLLDNCEHLLDGIATVAALLRATQRLVVLATSRARLRLQGERYYAVVPLDTLFATELFLQRAHAVAERPIAPTHTAGIAALVRRLDGLPLAIELAAARSRTLNPTQLLQMLQDDIRGIDLLSGGARDAQQHQQTLRDTILWSVRLLTPAAQRLFAQLSVFVGSFTRTATAAIDGNTETLAVAATLRLDELVDHHLVQVVQSDTEDVRFALLWAIREVAAELLEAQADVEEFRRRHATYYLALSEGIAQELRTHSHASALVRFDTEHDNLRSALSWFTEHDAACAIRLAHALAWYFRDGRIWAEGAHALDRVLALNIERTPEITATLIASVSWIDIDLDPAGAEARIRNRVSALHSDVERLALGHAFESLGRLLRRRADLAGAERWLHKARHLLRAAGDSTGEVLAIQGLGIVARDRGDTALAKRRYADALRRAKALQNPMLIAMAMLGHGDLCADAGDWHGAIAVYSEAGRDWPNAQPWTWQHLATAHMRIGELIAAEAFGQRALAGSRADQQSFGIAWSCVRLGELYRRLGRHSEAREYLAEALELCVTTGANATPATLTEIAAICATQGEASIGARLLGAADALRTRLGFPVWSCDHAAYEEIVEQLRTALGVRRFAQIRRADAALPFAEALKQARAAVGNASLGCG